eukprot:TRINITY_DN1273_c0_g1_i2.p1 TRINITY_DN1273_c0_g1~~TRINITY_DN1273_c0_g1_i2.p1  ORF type:complete len:250 (-),score=39.55 TRINITY_DN1273_c0_g1_i2:28-777(-)
MIVDCIVDSDALRLNGEGLKSILKVRLLHARVRQLITTKINTGTSVPINQQQMAVTLLTFSLIVISGLYKLGIHLSDQEQEDYVHLWRLVGYYMGIDEQCNPCTSVAAAKAVLTTTLQHQYNPTAASQQLANHVLECMAGRFPLRAPLWLHREIAHTVMGPDMARALAVPPPFDPHQQRWWWLSTWSSLGSFKWCFIRSMLRVLGWAAGSWAFGERLRRHNRRMLRVLAMVPLQRQRPLYELTLPDGHP